MKKINLALLATTLTPALAFAQDGASMGDGIGSKFMAAGLCMGGAAAVIGYSQSRAAVAALEGIGRNPASSKNSFVPLILSLALMEALALFAFLVANKIVG